MNILMRLVPLLVFFGLAGCGPDAPPMREDIVGKYWGAYGNGEETIELNPDGSFEQVFKVAHATIYASGGKWEYREGDILFDPFKVPAMMLGNDAILTLDRGRGRWQRDPIRMEIGEWPYHVRKILTDEK